TNMLRARASLRIQERVLGIEIVKAALWNYFKNRQGLITEDTYRQFTARYKFFHQQFTIVLSGLFHRRIEFVFIFHDHDPNGRSLPRRFYYQRHRHLWTLTEVDHFPLRRDDVMLAKFCFGSNLFELSQAFFYT